MRLKLKMFTILFKSHVHYLFWFQKCSVTSFRQCFGPIVQFHVATRLLRKFCQRCLQILLKSSKLSTTSSDTEGLPQDFSLLTLPVWTNLFITPLMWASNDVSWIIKLRYLAWYSCLHPWQNPSTLRLRSPIAITRRNNINVLFNRHKLRTTYPGNTCCEDSKRGCNIQLAPPIFSQCRHPKQGIPDAI